MPMYASCHDQLTSGKSECTWTATYQELFGKLKSIMKEDACMKCYDETQSLHLETGASGGRLGTALLPTTNGTSYSRDNV